MLTAPAEITHETTHHSGEQAFFAALGLIVEYCFDPTLLERQRNLIKYGLEEQAPVKPGSRITLGTISLENGEQRSTHIGNVEGLLDKCTIASGAHIGDGVIIRRKVSIGEGATVDSYSLLDHGVSVENNAVLERGAKLLVNACAAEGVHLPEGVEINYDRTVQATEALQPFSIVY